MKIKLPRKSRSQKSYTLSCDDLDTFVHLKLKQESNKQIRAFLINTYKAFKFFKIT